MRLIDADALYEQTAEWEARALSVIEKKKHKQFDEMDVNEIVEWRKWSCILEERSAFKHDVFDAPTIDAVQVIRCKDCKWWTKQEDSLQGRCALHGMYPTGEWFCANARGEEE